MGREMSRWYFDGGGLLLSVPARDAYFDLARALTMASFEEGLRVPKFPTDATDISREQIGIYCTALGSDLAEALKKVDTWTFKGPVPEAKGSSKPERFRDYIFLQQLSSQLRTMLAEDLRSRRRLS